MCASRLRLPTSGRLFLVALSLVLPTAVAAQTIIQLEAENMTAWYNTAGLGIVPVSCGAARGGVAVDGVDAPGEYIEWPLTLTQDLVFRDSLRTAGATGVVRNFTIQFLPAGGGPPVATENLTTPPGAGIG
jgi:hypothetical protein